MSDEDAAVKKGAKNVREHERTKEGRGSMVSNSTMSGTLPLR